MEWLVKIGETDYKAESIETLRQWVTENRIYADTYIFHPVLQKWMYAKDLEELREMQFGRPAVSPGSPSTPKKTSACSVILVIVLLGFLVLLFVGIFSGKSGTTSTSTASSSQVSSGVGALRAPTSGSHVVVATTEASLDEMARSGSDRAIAALILGGGGFLVPQGTAVSVIDSSGGRKKIVVTEGEMAGRTGWVPSEWVVAH